MYFYHAPTHPSCHPFVYPFKHLFNKYLLSSYYMPSTVLVSAEYSGEQNQRKPSSRSYIPSRDYTKSQCTGCMITNQSVPHYLPSILSLFPLLWSSWPHCSHLNMLPLQHLCIVSLSGQTEPSSRNLLAYSLTPSSFCWNFTSLSPTLTTLFNSSTSSYSWSFYP